MAIQHIAHLNGWTHHVPSLTTAEQKIYIFNILNEEDIVQQTEWTKMAMNEPTNEKKKNGFIFRAW